MIDHAIRRSSASSTRRCKSRVGATKARTSTSRETIFHTEPHRTRGRAHWIARLPTARAPRALRAAACCCVLCAAHVRADTALKRPRRCPLAGTAPSRPRWRGVAAAAADPVARRTKIRLRYEQAYEARRKRRAAVTNRQWTVRCVGLVCGACIAAS